MMMMMMMLAFILAIMLYSYGKEKHAQYSQCKGRSAGKNDAQREQGPRTEVSLNSHEACF